MDKNRKLSENFTLGELLVSGTAAKLGIDNTPSAEIEKKLERLAKEVLQPIRNIYGHPIVVNSGYRCPKLNTAIKGAKTSQHMEGEAADIRCSATSKKVLFGVIKDMVLSGRIQVGQLIWEYGTKNEPAWIHVSLPRNNGKKNNQILYLFN